MKISSFFLSTASVSADLFIPKQGHDLRTATFADAISICENEYNGKLANPIGVSVQQVIALI